MIAISLKAPTMCDQFAIDDAKNTPLNIDSHYYKLVSRRGIKSNTRKRK